MSKIINIDGSNYKDGPVSKDIENLYELITFKRSKEDAEYDYINVIYTKRDTGIRIEIVSEGYLSRLTDPTFKDSEGDEAFYTCTVRFRGQDITFVIVNDSYGCISKKNSAILDSRGILTYKANGITTIKYLELF